MNLLLTLIFILLLPIFSEEKSSGSSKQQPSKPQDKEISKAPSKENSKDSDKGKSKTPDKGSGKSPSKDKNPSKENEKNPEKDKGKGSGEGGDKTPDKDSGKSSSKDKNKNPSKVSEKNSGKDKETGSDKGGDKNSDKGGDKDSGKESDKNDPKKKPSGKNPNSNKITDSSGSKPNEPADSKPSESSGTSSSGSGGKGGKKPSKPAKPTPAPKKDELELWDTKILYMVDSKLKSEYIEIALERIQSRTCLKFEKVTQEDKTKEGIYFEKSSSSYAWYGKVLEKKFQRIHLSLATEKRVGYIMYLIGATLGLYPEHLRSDRDKYVKLAQEHFSKFVSESHKTKDTKKYPTFDMSYDYGSLMEVSAKYLSKDGEMTIKPPINEYVYMMGQRKGFTYNNYKYINYRYCSSACKNMKNPCKNFGYLKPKNCNECNCPNGYTGKLCEQVESSPKSCSKTALKASNKKATLQTAGIMNCTYTITASSNKNVVQLTIESVTTKKTIPCLQRKGLEIKYRKDRGAMGLNLCGTFQGISIVSETQDVLIQYIGMNSDNNFKITYVDKKNK
uniref:Metalloendopeptidase n=1 Tax=Strongyloides papillosus TaxID=174720 RepID=A0A0N5BJN1_STREA